MKKRFTRALAATMSIVTALSLAACSSNNQPSSGATATPTPAGTSSTATPAPAEPTDTAIEKPEKITFFIDTVFGSMMLPQTFKPIVDEYKARTGITLEFIKPDHSVYYEQLALEFAAGNIPDVIELGSTNFPTYAANGALWDMTSTWESSNLRASGVVDEGYVDSLKIDGALYAFPMARGNGTITYVRKDWLDNLGMNIPTNYDEFREMLRAFTEDDPDQNGIDDTFGITAPGIINNETPYNIYLPEFYQDATPDFYQDSTGKWVDGMLEPAMLAAIERMRDVYTAGYMDVEVVTNNTSAAREKFYAGQTGVFNYWAGNWNNTIYNNTAKNFPDCEVVPIPPTGGQYIERPSLGLAISNACENPEGVFEYLISYAYDGGEGQTLFTRGIEGLHYEKDSTGAYVQLPDPENSEKLFEKVIAAPELCITSWQDPIKLNDRLIDSLAMFTENRVFAPLPPASTVYIENVTELISIRREAVAKAVTDTSMTAQDALNTYSERGKVYIDNILAELNK